MKKNTKRAVLDQLKKDRVRFLRLQFTDIMGINKNVEVPEAEFGKAVDGQILFDGSSVQGFARFWAFGSGDEYALGAMRVAYPTASSAEEIARTGLEAAADFDASTGLPIEVHTIALKRP